MIRSFIENARLSALVIALILVAGLGALSNLPRTEDPTVTNRFASVVTHYPGASAERIEALVSDVLENQLRRLEELKRISSTSRPGISVIQLELKDNVMETDPVWSRARDLVADSTPLLPQNTSRPTLDDQIGFASTVVLGVTWNSDTEPRVDFMNRYAKELQSRIRLITGTDFVKLYGEPQEEVLVTLDKNNLAALKVTPSNIAQQILAADSKVSAGEINNQTLKATIEVSGELDSLKRIKQLPINIDADKPIIKLQDIADIKKQVKKPEQSISLINGQQGIMVAVTMLDNVRIDKWQQKVKATVDVLSKELPSNIKIDWLFEQQSYTEIRLGELAINLLQGFVLILIVLMITLGKRNAMIVAAALPLTALFTLACMKLVNLPIHQMSVTGLVVALGIMVDNAIVIVDAISQKRQQGQGRLQAVTESLKHLWLPLAGSTITTILAFTPIVLMPGPAGEFVGGIAISVIFALIGSYIISHTLIAGFAGRFSGETNKKSWSNQGISTPWLSDKFTRLLSLVLKKPLASTIIIGSIPVLGFIAATKLTEQFFPPSDRDMFHIDVFLSPQSSLDNTVATVKSMNRFLDSTHGVEKVDWMIGNNTPSFYYNMTQRQQGATNYAQAMVKTSHFDIANTLIPQLQHQLDHKFTEAQILVRKLEQGPPFNAPVEFRVYGSDLEKLSQIGDKIRQRLNQSDLVTHSRTTLFSGAPKVWVNANENIVSKIGLNLTDIARQIEMSTTGILSGSILEQTESLPVRVRLTDEFHQSPDKLNDIQIIASNGARIPLSAISTQEFKVSRGAIARRNGQRVNTIEAYVHSGVLPAKVLAEVMQDINSISLPAGYNIEVGGESAKRNEAVGKLLSSVALVMTLLITVVVLSFNSFRLTAIILLSAIQSAGLGLLAIYIFDFAFGFNVIIGLLGLMGLAINAAIVIIAELESSKLPREGDDKAIIRDVSSCTRHISSTTITTIGGFLPLILAGGGFWPPFATAIAGGTLLTTLISLLWVPAVYKLIMRPRKVSLLDEECNHSAAEA
ncbi:efflux RND transporter permease subunit [Shewanella sp. 202IG2-18]|uniref:efflux RND transporter permease subunit n=1 Tax=Parashewanella hymeniacidonis TaxID=2807618 RepID=UPI0019606109|nr:efflux RND transporter permease subunit [Parashewanella hymeniacidonis]MBM7074220.1 efflux RND transporter permease subunit [Parashewanella hymeniacidonis]